MPHSNVVTTGSYKFDNYILDPTARTLRHGGALVELTPKVFQTLLALVENHDRIMSKAELLHIIWSDQFVEEANLSQNISVLRRALGEATSGKKYIATFPGRGYRFLEPVTVDHAAAGNHNGNPIFPETSLPRTPDAVLSDQNDIYPPPGNPSRRILGHRGYFAISVLFFALGIVCAGILFRRMAWLQAPRPVSKQFPAVKTFARMDGALYQPSWSFDGTRVAFVHLNSDDTQSSIYVESVGDIQPRRIVYGPGKYSSPVWSPDGGSLAYLHMQGSLAEIVIFNIKSGTSRRLTTLFPHRYELNFRHLDWAPDGSFLVVDDKSVESDPLSLYLVYVSNGNKVRLTYPNMDIIGDVSPRVSPDGTQVAFVRVKYQLQDDVFVLPINGGEPRRLTGTSALISDVGWETNQSLVFCAKDDEGFKFWRVDLQSQHPKAELASSGEAGLPVQFSIAHGSRQIAFSAYRPDLNIWSVDLTKRPVLAGDWTPVIHTPGEDVAPSFSPDGAKVAFRSDISGQVQIWVSRADGSDPSKIDTGSLIPATHCWSANGDSIVFSATQTAGLFEASSSRTFPVRKLAAVLSHPSYSTDGKWIFARTHLFIYRIPAGGGPIEKVTNQGGAPIEQSKDGRYLYFGQGRMASTIARLDLSTGRQEVAVNSLIPGYSESWALTSRGIIFLGEQSGRPAIIFHDFTTGKQQRISDFIGELPPVGMSEFSLSPDEHRLLVVRADPAFAQIQTTTLTPIANH